MTDKYKLVDHKEVVQVINKPENAFKKGKRAVPIQALRCLIACYSPENCKCETPADNGKVKG